MSFVIAVLAIACDASPEQERRDVCTAYCDCVVSTPFALESCITDECYPLLPTVSEECSSCVYTNSQTCSELTDQCNDACFQSLPSTGGMR